VAPPPPPLADALRTIRVMVTDLAPYMARLATNLDAPSTTTEQGLASVRASFTRTLDRLGIELSVLHTERVPREGGLILFWNQESHLDHLVLASAIPRPFI
jgi:hypothetical protein